MNNYTKCPYKKVYEIINENEDHYFCYYLLENRSEKSKSQHKIGPYKAGLSCKNLTQNTFLYKSVNLYNSLPKELTLCKSKNIFKKWIKKYYLDKSITIPKKEDNTNTNNKNIIKLIIVLYQSVKETIKVIIQMMFRKEKSEECS